MVSPPVREVPGPGSTYLLGFRALSPRELEVLIEVGHGATSKEIARRLGISTSTVNKHVTAAMQVLGVRSRAQAVLRLSDILGAQAAPEDQPLPTDKADAAYSLATLLAEFVKQALQARSAVVGIWNRASRELTVAAASGPLAAGGNVLNGEGSPAADAFYRNGPVTSTDLGSRHPAVTNRRQRSVLCVPIRSGGRPIGVVTVTSDRPSHFTPVHLELLALIANQVGPELSVLSAPTDAG